MRSRNDARHSAMRRNASSLIVTPRLCQATLKTASRVMSALFVSVIVMMIVLLETGGKGSPGPR